MEWQEIKASPEKPTGVCKKSQGLFKMPQIVPVYLFEDVMCFYQLLKDAAVLQNLCCPEVFDAKNKDFLDAVENTTFPAETLEHLPVMYVPIGTQKFFEDKEQPMEEAPSEEEANFEEERLQDLEGLKRLSDVGMFDALSPESQLLVLESVDTKTKRRLLSEVTPERRKELFDAAASSEE